MVPDIFLTSKGAAFCILSTLHTCAWAVIILVLTYSCDIDPMPAGQMPES